MVGTRSAYDLTGEIPSLFKFPIRRQPSSMEYTSIWMLQITNLQPFPISSFLIA